MKDPNPILKRKVYYKCRCGAEWTSINTYPSGNKKASELFQGSCPGERCNLKSLPYKVEELGEA